jgi:hypothetical protein
MATIHTHRKELFPTVEAKPIPLEPPEVFHMYVYAVSLVTVLLVTVSLVAVFLVTVSLSLFLTCFQDDHVPGIGELLLLSFANNLQFDPILY